MTTHGPGGPLVVVNLKAYFGAAATRTWCSVVRTVCDSSSDVAAGRIEVIVCPSTPLLSAAMVWMEGSRVQVGAQDVSAVPMGPSTGEVPATLLAEVGCRVAIVGHAERRGLGDTDPMVAEKVSRTIEAGMTPILCVGEPVPMNRDMAIDWVVAQMRRSLAGASPSRVILAYEPIWAIGADESAPAEHVWAVCAALSSELRGAGIADSRMLYGGAAGSAQVDLIGGPVDGLFLGRSVHDPAMLAAMLGAMGDRLDGGAERMPATTRNLMSSGPNSASR